MANDGAANTQQFYRGVNIGCIGATVLLLHQQGVSVPDTEIEAFCVNVEYKARQGNMHDAKP